MIKHTLHTLHYTHSTVTTDHFPTDSNVPEPLGMSHLRQYLVHKRKTKCVHYVKQNITDT